MKTFFFILFSFINYLNANENSSKVEIHAAVVKWSGKEWLTIETLRGDKQKLKLLLSERSAIRNVREKYEIGLDRRKRLLLNIVENNEQNNYLYIFHIIDGENSSIGSRLEFLNKDKLVERYAINGTKKILSIKQAIELEIKNLTKHSQTNKLTSQTKKSQSKITKQNHKVNHKGTEKAKGSVL